MDYSFEIKILRLSIDTYKKNIDMYIDNSNGTEKYNTKILNEYRKIANAEQTIQELRYLHLKNKMKK